MRLRSFLQAQAAWAVARIVSHSLFSITLIFKCLLYSTNEQCNPKIENLLFFSYPSLTKKAVWRKSIPTKQLFMIFSYCESLESIIGQVKSRKGIDLNTQPYLNKLHKLYT